MYTYLCVCVYMYANIRAQLPSSLFYATASFSNYIRFTNSTNFEGRAGPASVSVRMYVHARAQVLCALVYAFQSC